MIVDHLQFWKNYFTGKIWGTIFGELAALNETTPDGVKPICGDDLVLKVFSYTTLDPHDDQVWPESHRRYLDIHTSIINAERIDWYPSSSLTDTRPYHAENDEIGYAKPRTACAGLLMIPGLFALFGPGDAHMPRLHAAGKPEVVKKAVMKIRADAVDSFLLR